MLRSDRNSIEISSQAAFVAVVDGKYCKTLAELFVQLNAVLNLPEYFGGNLDALYDCLCDLSWIEQPNVLLIITRSELLLSQATTEQKAGLLETLEQAESEQYDSERTLQVILLGDDQV